MIARDLVAERALYDALRASFGQDERTGTHLSALLNPLQEYWRRVEGRTVTDADLMYFTAGRGHEDILSRLLGQDFELTPEAEIEGIHLRPDFRAISDRIIPKGKHAEFKTRRANLAKTDEEAQEAYKSYREQIRGYMALKDQDEMYLIVLSLLQGSKGDGTKPVVAVYKETMTRGEMLALRTALIQRKILLESGVTSLLPLCWEFLCGKWVKKTEKVTAEDGWKSTKATWTYEPECPHYASCKPQLRDPRRGAKNERAEAGSPELSGEGLPSDPVRAEGQAPTDSVARVPDRLPLAAPRGRMVGEVA
jgi:hypothetical protein